MKTTTLTVNPPRRLAQSLPYLNALIFLVGFNLQADVPPTTLHLAQSVADTEGLATYRLDWNAVSNATYLVQSATDLVGADAWQTIDVVTPTNSAGLLEIKGRSIPENSVEYFRLILPQPQIFSVEPAVFVPGVPVDAYVIGQCFETNDVVRVDGVVVGSVIHLSNNMLQVPLPILSTGPHLVELVRGGMVKSSFTIMCADPLISPELGLQGPPAMEPPASPSAPARSKQSEAKSNSKAMFTAQRSSGGNPDLDDEGDSSPIAQAGARVRKGMQDIKNLAQNFEIQEGKKGLNAVNVKLARAAAKPDVGASGGPVVSPFSGEVQMCEADMVIPGRGLDFAWARTHRFRPGNQGVINFTLTRWTHSYDVAVAQTAAGISLADGTGRVDTYKLQTNGTYTCLEFFREGTLSNNTFTLTFADTGRWVFQPFDGSSAAGKLRQIITRNGDTMTLGYDPSGKLAQIVDDLDRTNTVTYDSAGRLARLTDFLGRPVSYQYYEGLPGEPGSAGDLKSVTSPPVTGTPNGNDFPSGKTTTYTYSTGYPDERENHLLLSVIDAKGETAHQYVYQHNQTDFDFLRCISAQHGTNAPTVLTYLPQPATPANQFATLRCIVNDPVGNVTESFFDARGRCVKSQEFTGRATPGSPVTATVNRPAGKLRASDPDYYETLAEWNNDSLLSKIKRDYSGDKTFSTWYASDFDPATLARKRADCRVVRVIASSPVDTDGNGTPDTTELAWYFEYDPRFGSSANMRTRLDELESRLKGLGLLGRTIGGNGVAIKTKGTGTDANRFANGPRQTSGLDAEAACSDNYAQVRGFKVEINGFVVSTTNPRGVVTEAEYDQQGNQSKERTIANNGGNGVEVRARSSRHNARGQLTAITNAPDATGFARVDMFDYYTNGPQQGYLKSCVVDAGGLALTESYEYDARGNVIRFINPRGHDTVYTYNALDQCVAASTPPNTAYPYINWSVALAYDANDNLVRCDEDNRDAAGTLDALNPQWTTRFVYDAMDRCTEVVHEVAEGGGLASYATNRFVYDANDNLIAVHSPLAVSGADPDNRMQLEYDERDLLFRAIPAPELGATVTNQWDYDANGNAVSTHIVEEIEFVVERLERDRFGRPGAGTDALSNVVTCAFDRNDNLVYQRVDAEPTDVPGNAGNRRYREQRWKYDAFDRCVEARTAFFDPATQSPIGNGASVTTFSYAPNGACTSVTDDNGHTTRYAYDTAGRLTSVTDPKTNVVSYTYDACGNILSVTRSDRSDVTGLSQQFMVVNGYDRLHRLTRSMDNVGNTNLYAYDSRDHLVSQITPREDEVVFCYDGLGNCTGVTNFAGTDRTITINTSHVEYDVNSRQTAATDSNGNTTHYAYDALDRCVLITEADGTERSLIWSPRSNLVREQDANGTVISNRFDLLDRCVQRDIVPGSGVAATTLFETFAYDGLSRLVAATNDASGCTFTYDSLGNCVRGTSGGFGAVTTTHDGVGNRLSMSYPSGRLVTYSYDALDQVASVGSGSGGLPPTTLTTYEYEGPGRVGRVNRANNVNTRIQWNGLVNPPNAIGDFGWGQVKGINHQVAGGGAVIDQRRATYDQNQNKTLRAQTAPFFPGGDTTTNVFDYDPLDRLSRAINTKGTGATVRLYALDGVGNRQVVLSNGVAESYLMDATIPPGDFQMNQYTMTPLGAQSYDENGNLIVKAGASGPIFYHYDYADRLVEIAALNGGGKIGLVASFSYDALGRRISKTTYPPQPLAPVTTQFVYGGGDEDCDGDEILEEYADGILSATYVYGSSSGGTARYTGDSHICTAARLVGEIRNGQTHFYHADDRGNVLALTDASGAVLERYDYDDFGLPQFLTSDGFPITTNAAPSGNPFLFHGMEWDSEIGFYLVKEFSPAEEQLKNNPRHRTVYVDPRLGRPTCRIDNGMPNRISMNVTVGKQTQGATFGEKVNQGLHAVGSALNNPWSGGGGGGGSVCAIEPRNILKTYFETGDIPTQDGLTVLGRGHTKTGHVTLMK